MLINQSKYKNIDTCYCSIDDEKTYLDNLKRMPMDWIWRTKKINYTTNSDGFRTKEISNINLDNYFLSFGDSTTFGIGLSNEDTYTSLISKSLNVEGINLGIPGAGTDIIYYNFLTFMEHISVNPKFIIIVWPNLFRKSWFREDADPYLWIPQHNGLDKTMYKFDKLSIDLSMHLHNVNTEFEFRRKCIKMMCDHNSIKLIEIALPWESPLYLNLRDINYIDYTLPKKLSLDYFNLDRARDWTPPDGGHYGPAYHNEILNFLEMK
jgi:hypothetical protein